MHRRSPLRDAPHHHSSARQHARWVLLALLPASLLLLLLDESTYIGRLSGRSPAEWVSVRPAADHCASKSHAAARPRALVTLLRDQDAAQFVAGAETLYKSALRHGGARYFGAWQLLLLKRHTYPDAVLARARAAGWRLRWVEAPVPEFALLHLWSLEQFSEVVFMTVTSAFVGRLRGSYSSLATQFTACKIWAPRALAPSGGWLESFSTDVFALRPSAAEGRRLRQLLAREHASSLQGLLNAAYPKATGAWCELEFEKAADVAAFTAQRTQWDAAARELQVVVFTATAPWACASRYEPVCSLWAAEAASGAHPVTVVTAFLPGGPAKHSLTEYAVWARKFLSQPVPIILFTPDAAELPAAEHLAKRPASLTRVVSLGLDELLASHRMFDWDKQLEMDPERAKHSTHLYKVWCEKPALVLRAIELNPFNSSHYVWVDFGIFRTAHWAAANWTVLAERFPTRDRVLLLNMPEEQGCLPVNSPTQPPAHFPSRKLVAGGIIGGSIRAWQRYAHAFYAVVVREMRRASAFVGDDQCAISVLITEQPGLACRVSATNASIPGGDTWWWFLQWYLAGVPPEAPECAEDAAAAVLPPAACDEPEPFDCSAPPCVAGLPLGRPLTLPGQGNA